MKKRSKFVKWVSLLISCMFIMSLVPAAAFAEDGNEELVDYVLILDCSAIGSAQDGKNSRIAAAKLFVDLLPTHNVRLTVLKMGSEDKSFESEKRKSYSMLDPENQRHMANWQYRMRTIYTLWSPEEPVETNAQREKLKAVIEDAYNEKEVSFSDSNCALFAATDTLKAYGAKQACVVLIAKEHSANYNSHDVYLPDGTIEKGGHDMYEDITDAFIGSEWTLNWLDITPGDAKEKSENARKNIENVCKHSNAGAVYKVSDITELPRYVANIIGKYVRGNGEGKDEVVVGDNGIDISLGTILLLTEVNAVVTGDGVTSVSVKDQTGKTISNSTETVWFNNETDPADAKHFFYSSLKLIRPESGEWMVHVDAPSGTSVYVQKIKTLQPDLELNCANELYVEGGLKVNTPLTFTGTFLYGGKALHAGYRDYLSDVVFEVRSNGAVVETIRGNDERITASDDQFTVNYVLERRGTFDFTMTVRNSDFQFGDPVSNTISNVTVENHQPKITGTIDDVELHIGEKADRIVDIQKLFEDEDGSDDIIGYSCTCEQRNADVEWTLDEENFLSVAAPKHTAAYDLQVTAEDKNGAVSDPICFKVTVVNNGPAVVEDQVSRYGIGESDTIVMTADAPEWATADEGILALLQGQRVERTIEAAKLFEDREANGDGLHYYVKVVSNWADEDTALRFVTAAGGADLAEAIDVNTGTLTFVAAAEGSTDFVIYTEDCEGKTAEVPVHVYVQPFVSTFAKRFLQTFWPILLLILILIVIWIILFKTRHLHGRWTIEVSDSKGNSLYHQFQSLYASKNRRLRKAVVPLSTLVNEAQRQQEGTADDVACFNLDPIQTGGPSFKAHLLGKKCTLIMGKDKKKYRYAIGETVISSKKKSAPFPPRRELEVLVIAINQETGVEDLYLKITVKYQ